MERVLDQKTPVEGTLAVFSLLQSSRTEPRGGSVDTSRGRGDPCRLEELWRPSPTAPDVGFSLKDVGSEVRAAGQRRRSGLPLRPAV